VTDFGALVTFAPGADRAPVVHALASAPPARRLIQPTLPGVHDGGDLILRFEGAPDGAVAAALAHPTVRHVDSAVFEPIAAGAATPDLSGGVYRILLLSVDPATPDATIRQFEAEMEAMPHYIPAIRNWRLSRVTQAAGARGWTHVWEQEYADLGGLLGAYMTHPYHWARIDRWFDPECPERIVDMRLCHSFCAIERSVL
jgi:hypothetical protein